MKINDKKFVAVSYDLYVGGEDGSKPELMERATEQQPLTFVFGMGMMLDSFEKQLAGLDENDTFDFTLPCDQAYGDYEQEHVVDLPKSLFTVDGKFDSENIAVDKMVPMMTEDGQRLDGVVLEVAEDHVKMDFNHPLAGEDLHFIGKVLEVRESTDEEMEALMHPCSCGDCHHDCCGEGEDECGCGCGHCH